MHRLLRLFPVRLIAFGVCCALLAGRSCHRIVRPKLWAEDGGVFLPEAYESGFWHFIEPYAGYQHLIPRLIAKIATSLPVTAIPAFLVVCCWLLLAWCLSEPASARFTALRAGSLVRIALCAGLCLAPGLVEVLGNLANLHSIAALWLLLLGARAAGARLRWAELVAVVLCTFSAGEAVLLFPLFAWRVLSSRWRGPGRSDDLLVTAAIVVATIANAVSHLSQPSDPAAGSSGEIAKTALHTIAYGLAIEPLAGSTGAARLWKAAPVVYGALAVALLALLAVAALRDKTRQTVALAIGIACLALLPLLTGIVRSPWLADGPSEAFAWWRYSFQLAPIGLVAWAVLLSRWPSSSAPWAAGALALVAVLLALPRWGIDELQAPRWGKAVEEARTSRTGGCAAGARWVDVPIAPAGWVATLPRGVVCDR